MALEESGRGAGGNERGYNLCGVPGLLLVPVDGHGGVGADIEVLLTDFLHGLLDDRDGDVEVLGVGRVDQGAVADLAGELKDLGALGTDVNRDALLAGQGDTGQFGTVVVEVLHLAGLLDLFTGEEAADLCDTFFQVGDGLDGVDGELRKRREVTGADTEDGASVGDLVQGSHEGCDGRRGVGERVHDTGTHLDRVGVCRDHGKGRVGMAVVVVVGDPSVVNIL